MLQMNLAELKAYLSRQSNRPLIFAIIILVVLRLPSLFESFWYGDEGIYAAIADGLVNGKTLYTEIWDHKPPLLYWIYALGALSPNWDIGLAVVKGLSIVTSIISLAFIWAITAKLFAAKAARLVTLLTATVLLGLPYLEPNTANAEIFFIPLNAAILWLILRRQWPLLIGVLAGLGLLLKFHSLFEAGVVVLLISLLQQQRDQISWPEWWRHLATIVYGGMLVVGTYLLITLVQGSASAMLDAAVFYNFGYSTSGQDSWQIAGISLGISHLLLLTLIAMLGAIYWLYRIQKISFVLAVVSVVVVTEYAAAIVSGRPYGHYALQVVPGVALLLGYVIERQQSIQTIKNKIWPVAIACTLILGMWFGFTRGQKLASLVTPEFYYSTFIQSYILQTQPQAFAWKYGYDVPKLTGIARHVRLNYPGQQSYYLYGGSPWLYVLIDKPYTNKYLFWFHVEHNPELAKQNQAKADLLIVDTWVKDAPEVVEQHGELWQKQEEVDGFAFYLKNK